MGPSETLCPFFRPPFSPFLRLLPFGFPINNLVSTASGRAASGQTTGEHKSRPLRTPPPPPSPPDQQQLGCCVGLGADSGHSHTSLVQHRPLKGWPCGGSPKVPWRWRLVRGGVVVAPRRRALPSTSHGLAIIFDSQVSRAIFSGNSCGTRFEVLPTCFTGFDGGRRIHQTGYKRAATTTTMKTAKEERKS